MEERILLDAMTLDQAGKIKDGLTWFFNEYRFAIVASYGLYAVSVIYDKRPTAMTLAKMTAFGQGISYGMSK